MIPRYCLPCPRASMSARNSFLSWISFTTGRGEGASVYRALRPSGSWLGWQGQGLPLGERRQFCGQCFSLGGRPLPQFRASTHTPRLHNWPTGSLRSSNLSSSGAGFACRTGGGFLFRSCLSFPVAKMFWSLCFSFSRSPVRPRNGLVKARREPHSWSVPSWVSLLQGAWATSRGLLQSRPLPPRELLSLSCQERQE